MERPKNDDIVQKPLFESKDVRLSVRDFGPIAEGHVDIRPLTVFVGPSNTGKTYLAVLMYALHLVFGGLARVPLLHRNRYWPSTPLRMQGVLGRGRETPSETIISSEDLQEVLRKLNSEGRPFRLSDLPGWQMGIKDELNDFKSFDRDLSYEVFRCFDLESESEIIRKPGPSSASVFMEVTERAQRLRRLNIRVSETKINAKGKMEDDAILVYGGRSRRKSEAGTLDRQFAMISRYNQVPIFMLMDMLTSLNALQQGVPGQRSVHYLPAVRGGIMQSHRVIASALMSRFTRAGIDSTPEIPTFSGGVADFMQKLLLYKERANMSSRTVRIAELLEREILAGRIQLNPSKSGYPEFAYCPSEMKNDIRLARASSMVSELAPIVLFLRGMVKPGDTLIVEEPEAHLHPAAQTQVAIALARLVRAGVRVVVTTHSDWLLQQIANLIREGEVANLPNATNKSSIDNTPPSWLDAREVGVWRFIEEQPGIGSRVMEIPFDPVDGVHPADYEQIEEALYNRSADLQNWLVDIKRTRMDPI